MCMCTIGAKILQPGREFILFKNRDFTRRQFDDQVVLTDQAFGVLGVETWDGHDPANDRFSGFSLGFNGQLACCDSNVKTVPGGVSYDQLVQAVVENCVTIDEAVEFVRALVSGQTYNWSNLIIATSGGVAVLEVRDHHVEVERHTEMIARANTHINLGASPDDDDTSTSLDRYQLAHDGLPNVSTLDDVFPLLAAKVPGQANGICNESLYHTVYSYVVHWRDGLTAFYVHRGAPQPDSTYVRVPVNLGDDTDLSAYPSQLVD